MHNRDRFRVFRSGKAISEVFLTEGSARRWASRFRSFVVEVWRIDSDSRPVELVTEYGGRAA